MNNKIFIVIKVTGEAFRQTANRLLLPIRSGDIISEGDIVVVKDGNITLQNSEGINVELSEGSAVLLHDDGTFIETPESILLLSVDPTPNNPSELLSSDNETSLETGQDEIEEDVVKDGHTHVRLERIHFEYGDRHHTGRDSNETHTFETRATRNPRIGFNYDYPEDDNEILRTEIEDPYSKGGWVEEENGWFNSPPELSTNSVVTDEDIPLIIDLMKYAMDPEGHSMTVLSATALYGSITINPDGTITYTPNEDYHGPDKITYEIVDAYGAISKSTVDVTVNPVQDAFDDADTTDEDTPVTLNVMVNDTFGPNANLTSVTQGSNGTVTFDKHGNVTYTPGPYYQSLAVGQTATDTFTYTVTTAAGNTETATVTITITGVNDAPVAVADIHTVYEDGADQAGHNDGNPMTTIVGGDVLLNDSDIDNGDVINVTGVAAGSHAFVSGNVATVVNGTYGYVVINADGTYTYTLDNSKSEVQALAKDQKTTDTFTYTITDPHGATDTTTLTITVVGTNDAPSIHVRAGDSAAAYLTESDTTLTANGTLSLTDVDIIDVVNATKVDSVTKGGSYAGPYPTDAELKAMFSVSGNLDATETDKTGGITWNFDSGTHFFNELAAGETLELTYTVQVTDPHGATDTQDVVITITGTNDAPVILGGGVLSGSATELVDKHANENTHDHTVSGYFEVTDEDLSDTISASATPQGAGYLGTLTPTVDTQTTNGATGKVTWDFVVNDADLDHLAEGETLTQIYDVTVNDGKGGTATETVTITITGSNDAPEIHVRAGDSADETLTESNSTLAVVGTLSLTDVDIIDVVNATKVDSITKGGSYAGPYPTDAELKAMFSVSGNLDATETDKTGGITWDFNSGSHYFNELAAGETLILTYTVQVTDPHGATDTQDVIITITGTNDAPVILGGGVLSGSATELVDKHANENTHDHTVSGYFEVTDEDLSDTISVSTTPQGVGYLGTLTPTVDTQTTNGATGKVTWDFVVNDADLDHLAEGQVVTQQYDVIVDDGKGGIVTETVTITITGSNDAPEIEVRAGDSVAETLTESDTTLTTSGTLSLLDVDVIDVVNATKVDSITKGGTYTGTLPTDTELKAMFSVIGGLTNTESDKDNGITWNFDSGTHFFDELAAGETLELTYTVQVADPHGGTDTQDVVITIVGTNDDPVINVVNPNDVKGTVTELVDKHADENTLDHTTSGYFDVTDADLTDAVSVSATPQGVGYLGTFTPVVDTQTTGGATGKITWEFKVNDAALDHLAEGETVTQLYDVTVDDGKGGTATQVVEVTITGSNDAPEIEIRAGDSVAETLTETDTTLATSGTLSLLDVDVIDIVNATKVDSITKGGTYTGPLPTDTELKAMFSVTGGLTNTESDKDNGITWNFDSGTHFFNELAAGETLTLTYTVQVTDPHGATDTQNVVITIIGTNDAPIAIADVDNVKEDTVVEVNGNVLTNDTDLDFSDTHEVIGVKPGYIGAEVSGDVGNVITGEYGTLTIDFDGKYKYVLDNAVTKVQELREGQKVYDVFTYTMQDSEGAKSTTTVTITVEGTNDIPVAVADTNEVKEDVTVQATGDVLLNDTDVDAGDTKEVVGVKAGDVGTEVSGDVGSLVAGTYGTLVVNADGTYTYDLDNSATNVQELREGQKVYDVFTYTIQDSEGAKSTTTVTITVEGTNDIPVAVADANEVKEDVTLQATGNVLTNDTDVDAGDTKEVVGITAGDTGTEVSGNVGSAITGSYGTLVVNADGTYTYDLDNLSSDVQSLAKGQKVEDVFTYTMEDAEGATSTTSITITVEGTNDAPEIRLEAGDTATSSVTETDTTLKTDGTLSVYDIDKLDDFTPSVDNSVTVDWPFDRSHLKITDQELIDMFEVAKSAGYVHSTTDQLSVNAIDWSFDSNGYAFDEIPAGVELKLIYTVVVDDGHGGTTTQNVTIIITGTNDAPVALPDTNTAYEDAADQFGYDDSNPGTTIVAGNVKTNDSDIDHNDTFSVTGVAAGTPVSASGSVAADVVGTYGTVKINADGTYTYTLDNTKDEVQALAKDQEVTDTFTYTITDSQGATATTTLTITVIGTNDAPVIHVKGTDSDAETITETNAGLSTSGTLSVFDIDTLDTVTADKVNSVVTSGTYTGPMLTDEQLLAMFTVTGGDSSTTEQWSNQGINWTFNSGTYPFDEIPAGEKLDIIYTVRATDNNGAYDDHNVIITITGTNDAPVAVPDTNTVYEDAADQPGYDDSNTGTTIVAGNVITNDSDIDHGDTFKVTGVEAGSHASATGNVAAYVSGTYGYALINADGTYTYTLDNGRGIVQALAVGETVTDTFTYTITDSQGATATTTLTITVVGTNDKPVIHVVGTDSDAETLTETNEGLSTSGTLTVHDIDTLDTVTADKVNSVVTSGTYTGPMLTDAQLLAMFTVSGGDSSTTEQWSYQGIDWTFNSGTYPFDEIPAGETLIITYTVRATDNHGAYDDHNVTITITGTNDAPVAVPDTNTVYEDAADQPGYDDSNTGTTIVAGNVITNDTDIDHLDTRSVTGVEAGTPASASGSVAADVVGTYGTVKINADGTYTYTLDNTKDEVQALAKDQEVTDTFTYTITDSQGATATTTLTITVIGTNDDPEIRLDAGDSDAEALTETNAGLFTSGTLSVFDVDTLDTPVATKVNTVSIGGTYSGPQLTEAQLIAMFSVTGGNNDPTNQYKANGIEWEFNSGTYPFDELPHGQTLILTYTVQLDDGNGGITTKDVTITITGTNDDGVINDDTANINEDTTLLGNVLSNDEPDPDYNEPLEVFSFTVDSDGDGVQDSYTAGDTVTITTSWGTIGTLTLNADGSYEFIPYPNYSGPVPTITYNAGNSTFSDDATLSITVNPVADKPDVSVVNGNIQTNEDTEVSLGLKLPLSTDNVDLNGSGVDGDNPELLGPITLSGIPAGAKIYYDGGVPLESDGSSITIVIDDTSLPDYHVNGALSLPGVWVLTQAQYESLKVLPPKDSGVNFSVTVSVTSYEVDEYGVPYHGVPGAENSETVYVDVLAVTDPVDLWINGADSYDATIDEDTSLDLSALLTKQFDDTDGSEQRSIVISGLPVGTVVNGTTIGGSGTITIPLTGGNTIPSITVKPPKDFSGDITNITVTLTAQDTDSDSSHTPNVESDSVTLNIYVNPIAGDVKVSDVSTLEDTAVKFLEHLEVTDTDGSEEITGITINALQVGWVIRDGGGNPVFTGNGTDDYTIPTADLAGKAYQNYTITPPAHSSKDESIDVKVTTVDTQIVNGVTETSTVVSDLEVAVEVTPVAEVVGTDSDGDGIDDLTMNGDFTYTTEAYEDTWFELKTDGFDFKGPWHNQDPDEQTFALLKPILNGGLDSAIGSQIRYETSPGTWVTLTYKGNALEIPIEYLDTVEFKAAHNVKGTFTIEVQAKTIDVDPDTGQTVSKTSGNAELINLNVLPVADKVTLAASSPVNTSEDTEIALKVKPSSSDPSETFRVTISSIPDGAKIYYDGVELTVTSGSVTIDNFSSSKSLSILPPHNSNENFELNVSAVSVDTLGGYTDISDAVSLPLKVNVKGVADPAILDVKDYSTSEAVVDVAENKIALSNVIDNLELTDTDGSETLTLVLTGLDPAFNVEGATYVGGEGANRVWIVDTSKLGDTFIKTDENFSGTIDLNLRAITTEDDGDSLTGPLKSVVIEVAPSPEATIVSSTTTNEDTLAHLNFNIDHHNDDNDETLTSVWIKVSDVEGKDFTLYFGNGTSTTLASAVGSPGVIHEDGYYKLTDGAWSNIYAKGAPNTHGSFNFDIKYEITDPSSDTTLPSVTEQTDGNYTFNVDAVTDPTETLLDSILGNLPSVVVSGNEVTVTENSIVTININIEQLKDPNGNNEEDYDGSEKLVMIVLDGVPNGVTVENGVYIGNTPHNPNTGQWLINVDPEIAFNGALSQTIILHFDGTAAELASLNQNIIISAHSQDVGSVIETSSTTINIITPADFDDTNSSSGSSVNILEAEFIPIPTTNEDSPITLADITKFTIDGNSDFSITLTGLPEGTIISGMTRTFVDGQPVWTASGTGGNLALQTLLSSIMVTPPLNWNSNNNPNLSFDATLTTYSEGGVRDCGVVTVDQPITPVTDPTDLSLIISDALEGDDVSITINMSNPADNENVNSNIVGNKVYISLDESDMDSSGSIWYDGSELVSTYVTGVDGVPTGYYYIIDGVTDITQPLDVTYKPGEHSSGQASITTIVLGQEDNADNIISNSSTDIINVEPVNSGYDISTNNISGNEDGKIALDYTSTGLIDNDGSESVLTAILGNVPVGYLVYYGADEASSTLANNIGLDGFGNTSWSIPINGGSLPDYIAILPPEHYSGTITDLSLTVYSGEEGLDPTASTATFDMEVIPFADGLSISPTNTFGNESGYFDSTPSYIPINLNASLIDTDGSETVTVELTGIGEHASFYVGNSMLSSSSWSYNSTTNTYTISGIEVDNIDNLSFMQSAFKGSVGVTAYTVETANSDTSTPVTGSFDVDISEQIATTSDDTLLYAGGKSIDGMAGTDTVVMRFDEGINFDTNPTIRNIEIFDLRGESSGSNSLENLSVQDVIDMTDSNNTLTIYGDSNDSVSILYEDGSDWTKTAENIGGIDFDVYTHTVHTDVVLKIQQDLATQLIDVTPDP